ncbi:MAG: transporter substrate-binding domain-containing protein [Colwelliaceae bacterium]|jgi:hypothetical protein|nr:transporter substrate-binding domain-containing protein [Colwelliaceae bacterium]
MKLFFYIILSVFIFDNSVLAQTIAMPGRPDEVSFPHTILKEVMKKGNITPTFPYSDIKGGDLSFNRMKQDMITSKLDVFWTMTSKELEEEFIPIYIPIFRGLLGMRIPLVKSENVNIFSSVNNLTDLTQYKAGSGKTWSDTEILEHNNIPVVKTLKYQNLFPMLEGGRFDYFPRGLHEPWQEILDHPKLNLAVENNILIRYTAPNYFFVSKDNPELAKQITTLLNELITSGEFVKLFFQDNEVKNALSKANVKNRVVFEIENPTLSENTPINRKELWFDPLEVEGN